MSWPRAVLVLSTGATCSTDGQGYVPDMRTSFAPTFGVGASRRGWVGDYRRYGPARRKTTLAHFALTLNHSLLADVDCCLCVLHVHEPPRHMYFMLSCCPSAAVVGCVLSAGEFAFFLCVLSVAVLCGLYGETPWW
eukprot:scaffold221699_cov33-Tisochrysis_lutea.AAC.1